jgi:hypothetical protein
MKLLEIQDRMFRAVTQPLTAGEHMQHRATDGRSMQDVAAEFIKPNDRLSSFERLEIYNRQYWFRVLDALNEDFAGLRAIVGGRRFEALCKAYLVECPSKSFTMRNLGAGLESWLQDNAHWIQSRAGLALDMVRLEWAEIEAFDAAAEPALTPQDLAASDADPKFRLQPYVRLLGLHYAVDDLLVAIRHGHSDSAMASNAMSEPRKRGQVHKVSRQKAQSIFVAVHRIDQSVYFKRLEPEAFVLLQALREESSLSTAVATAFEARNVAESEILSTVQNWFESWSTLGWLCQAQSVPTEFISSSRRQS